MKLYNNNQSKGNFQSFVNFTKKKKNDTVIIFGASLFIRTPYNIRFLTFILFKHVKVGKHIEYMRQKLSKNMLIVKFHPSKKCLHIFFFFHPRIKSHPGFFYTGIGSSQTEISFRRKRVNSFHHRQG